MYAVIVDTTLYIFHTQDSVAAPAADMQDAIHAIESVKFKGIEGQVMQSPMSATFRRLANPNFYASHQTSLSGFGLPPQ
jgi:hypothetical protein